MNLSETARLLGAMAAFDRRTVGNADVIAWQAIMEDIPLDDAMTAVKQHYSESDAWLMPVHVRTSVKAIQDARRAAARATGWAPGQAGVPKDQAMPEIAGPVAESELTPSVRALLESVRAMLPEGSREALMPRTVAWEREHAAFARQRDGKPNPYYRPGSTGNLYDGPPDRDDPAMADWLKARGWPSYEAWANRDEQPHGWLTCALCGNDVRDLPGHVADYHPGAAGA